jgi:phospholipid transport system substrate-binding protein
MLSVSMATRAQTTAVHIPEKSAQEVVGRAITEFQQALSEPSDDPNGSLPTRLTTIERVISRNVDIRRTSRLVLGAHWPDATGEERKQFIALFHRFVSRIAVLMASLGTPTDATDINISFLPTRTLGDNRYHTIVRTVVSSGSDQVRMDYYLHREQDLWAIYDVVMDGVSFVRPVRASVDSFALNHGIDGLIARLEQKVTETLAMQ